jgi:hypothetical protein
MARVTSVVASEGISVDKEAAFTPSAAANNPRKTLSARATWTTRENFRRKEANNFPTCIPLEALAYLDGSVRKTWRGRRDHQVP